MMHRFAAYDAMLALICLQAHIIRRSRHHSAKPTSFAEGKHHSKKRTFVDRQKCVFVGGEGEISELTRTPISAFPLYFDKRPHGVIASQFAELCIVLLFQQKQRDATL